MENRETEAKRGGLGYQKQNKGLRDQVEELQAALVNPSEFLEKLIRSTGPAAKKFVLAKLRPTLEPHLEKHGLSFEDVTPALEQVDSVEPTPAIP